MQLIFYLTTFSTQYMSYLLYLMFRCDFDVMDSLEILEEWEGTKHSHGKVREKVTSDTVALFVCLW